MKEYLEKLNRNQKIVVAILAPVLLFFLFYGVGKESLELKSYQIYDLDDSWGLWTVYICSIAAFYLYFFNTSIEGKANQLNNGEDKEKISVAEAVVAEDIENRHIIPESYNFNQGKSIYSIKEDAMSWLSSNKSHNLVEWNIAIEKGKIILKRSQNKSWFAKLLPLIIIVAITALSFYVSAFLKIESLMVNALVIGALIFLVTAFGLFMPSINRILISDGKLSTFIFKNYRFYYTDFNFSDIETHSEYINNKIAHLVTFPTNHQFTFVDNDKSNISSFDFNQLFGTNINISELTGESVTSKVENKDVDNQLETGLNQVNENSNQSSYITKNISTIIFTVIGIVFILAIIGNNLTSKIKDKYKSEIDVKNINEVIADLKKDNEEFEKKAKFRKSVLEIANNQSEKKKTSQEEVDYYLDGEPVFKNSDNKLNGDKLLQLYNQYKDWEDVELGTFEQFKSRMQDESVRNEFYDYFSQYQGQNIGKDFAEFESIIDIIYTN